MGIIDDVKADGFAGLDHNFLTGKLEDLVKWSRSRSQWPALRHRECCVTPACDGTHLMSFADVYNAHLVIGSHPITYREIVGNVFGLASAVGGLRRRVWAWPVGIVGNVCLFTVFLGTAIGSTAGTPLLGQAGRQVFFVITSGYGWRRWRATRRSGGGSPSRCCGERWRWRASWWECRGICRSMSAASF